MTTRLEKTLWFIFILLLPSQTALHFWPAFSIINGIRVDYLSPAIFLTDLLAVTLVLVKPPRLVVKKNIILIIFLLMSINILFSLSPLLSLYKFTRTILYIFIFLRLAQSWETVKPVFKWSFPLTLLWTSFLTAMQFVNQGSLGIVWRFLGERPISPLSLNVAQISLGNLGQFLRPYATFPHPNALAGFLLVSFWFLAAVGYKTKLISVVRAVIAVTIILTFSRSVILIFILSLLCKSVYKHNLPSVLLSGLALVFACLFALSFGATGSVAERLFLMNKFWSVLTRYPLTGSGLGTFPLVPYSLPSSNPFLIFQPVHNCFLLLLSETGLFFIPIFGYGLVGIYNWFKSKTDINLIMAFTGLSLTSMVDHYWVTSTANIYLLIFLLVAVKVNSTTISND